MTARPDRQFPSPDPTGGLVMTAAGMARQFVRFALVGIAAAIGHYGTLIALAELFAISPVPASAAGFIVGAIVSYTLNYRFVFRSAAEHLPTATRFVTVAAIGLGLNSTIMGVLTHWAGLHYLVAQILATSTVMVWSYGANRVWTFERRAIGA